MFVLAVSANLAFLWPHSEPHFSRNFHFDRTQDISSLKN